MLSLDDRRWGELDQAYGSAEDVPRLLAALAATGDENARAELWFALWRMLHRPGEVFTASYAAAPHLLAAAERGEAGERAQAVHLVTRIELARRAAAGAASVPDDLVEAYAAAIERLPAIVADAAREPWSAEVAQVYLAALASGKRQPDLAEALLKLDLGA